MCAIIQAAQDVEAGLLWVDEVGEVCRRQGCPANNGHLLYCGVQEMIAVDDCSFRLRANPKR